MAGRCYFRIQDGCDFDSKSAVVDWYDLLIWEGGDRMNRNPFDVLEYDMRDKEVEGVDGEPVKTVNFGTGAIKRKYVNGVPTTLVSDFDGIGKMGNLFRKTAFGKEDFKGVKHLSPFNTYNKRVDYGDLEEAVGVYGRTYAAYSMYGKLNDYRKQAIQYNQFQHEEYTRNIRRYDEAVANYPTELANATSDARANWGTRLQEWQSNEYTNDIMMFSNEGAIDDPFPDPTTGDMRGLTSVEMIFSSLMREISPDVAQWNPFSKNNTFWNLDPASLLGLPTEAEGGPGAWETYRPPTVKPPTKPTKGNLVKVPSDTWEKIAKGYFIAEVCLMGVVALLHLYDAVKGQSDATIRSSGWQVNYGPSLIQNHDADGAFGRYLKNRLRARDVLGNARTLITAIFSGIGHALGWVRDLFDDGTCHGNPQCERAQADAHKIGVASLVETTKEWRRALRALLTECNNETSRTAGRRIHWYEKDLLQHYAALEMQVSTNMQVLGQLENLAAEHWPTNGFPSNSKFTVPQHDDDGNATGSVKMKWPAQFRVNIVNPGVWGYIQSIEILDPGEGAHPSNAILSIGEGLKMSGIDDACSAWGTIRSPEIKVTIENGKAVAVAFESNSAAWVATYDKAWAKKYPNQTQDKFGRGFYSPPALVVDPVIYGGFDFQGRIGGMHVENGFMIAQDTHAGDPMEGNKIVKIEDEEPANFNHPSQKYQIADKEELKNKVMIPVAHASQMANKYKTLYEFAKGTLLSARRGIECRFISTKDKSKALEDVFKDGSESSIREASQHSKTYGKHTHFEGLKMYHHDRNGSFEDALKDVITVRVAENSIELEADHGVITGAPVIMFGSREHQAETKTPGGLTSGITYYAEVIDLDIYLHEDKKTAIYTNKSDAVAARVNITSAGDGFRFYLLGGGSNMYSLNQFGEWKSKATANDTDEDRYAAKGWEGSDLRKTPGPLGGKHAPRSRKVPKIFPLPTDASSAKPYWALQCGAVGNPTTANPNFRGKNSPTKICYSRGYGFAHRHVWKEHHDDGNNLTWTQYATELPATKRRDDTDFYPYVRCNDQGNNTNIWGNEVVPDFSKWGVTCFELRGRILYGSWTKYVGTTSSSTKVGKRNKTTYTKEIFNSDFFSPTTKSGAVPGAQKFGPVLKASVSSGIDEMYTVSWRPGHCSENEIKNFSKNLSKMFFDDLPAYNVAMKEQRHKESVCDKRACGAVHAYTNLPSIGKSLKNNACGNVEIMMNFHPDTARIILDSKDNQENFWTKFLGGVNSKFKGHACTAVGTRSWLDYTFGTKADISLPPIFANWTVIKTPDGDKYGSDRSSIWSRLFRGFAQFVTLGQASRFWADAWKTNDPVIDHSLSAYTKDLVKEYHTLRMYKKDYSGGASSYSPKSTMYKLGGTDDARRYKEGASTRGAKFGQTSAADMVSEHVKYLHSYYDVWAEETGIGHSIKAINHETRRFSGVCNPIIRNTGITYAPFMFGASGELPKHYGGRNKAGEEVKTSYEPMGAPGLGKRFQEIGLTDPSTFFSSDGVDRTEGAKMLGNVTNETPTWAGGNQNSEWNGMLDKAKSEKKGKSSEKYIEETFPSQGEFRVMVDAVDKQLGAFSAMLPVCVVTDVSYHTWWKPYDLDPADHENWVASRQYHAGRDTIVDGVLNGNSYTSVNKQAFICLVDHTPEDLKARYDEERASDPQYEKELGYSHPDRGRPWVPNGIGPNEYWEICTDCEATDTASGVFIDEGAGDYLAMDYSGFKQTLGTIGGNEKKVLEALVAHNIKMKPSWTSAWNAHFITGKQERDPHVSYAQTKAQYEHYGQFVNQFHYTGKGEAMFINNKYWDRNADGTPAVYSGVGYDCDPAKAEDYAYVDLSGSSEFVPDVTPIPTTIIHGRVLPTGATDARSGVSGEVVQGQAAGYYVSTEIKQSDKPCWSRWDEAAGTGRWDPAPPCISPLKHTFNLTGIGTDCAAAEAAAVTARLTHEGQSPLGLYQNSGCGFTWQDQKELSADWPTSWVGTGTTEEDAIGVILMGDSTATAYTPPNSGYLNWQDYIQYHHFVPETPDNIGFYDLLGVPACVPGVDRSAWQGYIEALPTSGPQLTCTAFPPTAESWDGTYSNSLGMYATIQGFGAYWPTWNAGSLTYEQLRMVSGTWKSVAYETINRELELGWDHAHDPDKYDVTTTNGVTTATRSTEQSDENGPNGTFEDVPVCLYPTSLPVTAWEGQHPTLTYYTDENGGWKNLIVGNLKDHSEEIYENCTCVPAQSGNATGHSFAVAEAMEYTDNGDGTYSWGGASWFTSICGFPQRGAGVECVLNTDCACVKSLDGEAEQAEMVDNEPVVWRTTVTGQFERNNWRHYLPLYKNVYSGMFIVSGEYPVVTGTLDWSASQRQVWKQEIHGEFAEDGETPHTMAGQPYWTVDSDRGDNGIVDAPEMYMATYEDADLIIHTGISGLSASQLSARKPPDEKRYRSNVPSLNPTSKTFEPSEYEKQAWDWGPMNTGVRKVGFAYAQGTESGSYGDELGDANFMMGRPLINQEFAKTGPLVRNSSIYNEDTPFGWTVILLDDKAGWNKAQADLKKGKAKNDSTNRRVGRVLWAKDYANAETVDGHTLESVVRDKMGIAQSSRDGKARGPNIQWDYVTSPEEFDIRVSQASILQNVKKHESFIRTILDPKVKGSKRVVMMWVYQNAAAACDSCVSHKIGTANFDGEARAGEEMFMFNENQKMGMGATWELRSGDWNFSIPYTVDAQEVIDPRGYDSRTVEEIAAGGELNERTIIVQPWIETVKYAWRDIDGLYTGQESFYAIPGHMQNFEIGCALDDQKSKLDKIIDYQHIFLDGASYENMVKGVKNPDGSDKEGNANKGRAWNAEAEGGFWGW